MIPVLQAALLDVPRFSPPMLPSLAAWYDASDLSSMFNNAGTIPASGDGIKLWADKSGNSITAYCNSSSAAGNYASAPHAANLQGNGNLDLRAYVGGDWSASKVLIAKRDATITYQFTNISGTPRLNFHNGSARSANSTAAYTAGIYRGWARVTYNATTGDVVFYTSTDGSNWIQLGSTVTGLGTGNLTANTAQLTMGWDNVSGTCDALVLFRAQVIIAGVTIFDDDLSLASKLSASHVAATGQTVTINTSGDTGGRISGERDLYQGTVSKQPILTIASSANKLTFDGTDDYMKAAPFNLSQPETVYFIGSQLTWTLNDYFFDGGAGVANVVGLRQSATTPNIRLIGGGNTTENTGLPIATNGVITSVINVASSSTRINRTSPVTGDVATASAPNGFILAARGDAAAGFGNITTSEIAIYAAEHNQQLRDKAALGFGRKWKIAQS